MPRTTTSTSRIGLMLSMIAALFVAPAFAAAQTESVEKKAEEKLVYVKMETSKGDIFIELNHEKAPITVENFLQYAKDDAYDGTVFHRVMDGFMIQGGGFDGDYQKRATRQPIKNEWKNGLKNAKYTIAMARLPGRADSATNQFFINVRDNFGLDQPRDGSAYAVFGKVVKGTDVVDKIRVVAVSPRGPHQHAPVEAIMIKNVTRLSGDDLKALKASMKEHDHAHDHEHDHSHDHSHDHDHDHDDGGKEGGGGR